MKKWVLSVITFCWVLVAAAQADSALTARLNRFLQANRAMDLEKVLDFTYPKVFTIAPRAAVLDALKNSFDNDQMTIKMDALATDSVYPVFRMQEGSYARILYSMKMIMQLKSKEPDAAKQKEINEAMLSSMQAQFGDKVSIDSNNNIIVAMQEVMVAVKDKYAKQWCFVNFKEQDAMTSKLFSREVIDKLSDHK